METDHTVDFRDYQLPFKERDLPAAGEVDLWWIDLDGLTPDLFAVKTVAEGISQRVQSRRFTSRFILRTLLGAYLRCAGKDVRLLRNRHGKPRLHPEFHASSLHFNISHSHQWLLIAVGDHIPLGVDIEFARRRTDPNRLAKRYFSTAEQTILAELAENQQLPAFLSAWTQKEAILKALGKGLAGHMGEVIVDMDPATPPSVLADAGAGHDWTLFNLDLQADMIGALACPAKIKTINARRLLPAII